MAEEIISLDNGCACCTVRGDLLKSLAALKDRRKDFDLILVETTGMANPAPVVATFTQNATMMNHFRVDGVICLVDCKYIKDHLNEVRKDDAINESVCQIAFADRVLLNKQDPALIRRHDCGLQNGAPLHAREPPPGARRDHAVHP